MRPFSPPLAWSRLRSSGWRPKSRHLQRTEVLEAEEYFAPGQKGSSAMPHKRKPGAEREFDRLARVVRSAVTPALENVALWQ